MGWQQGKENRMKVGKRLRPKTWSTRRMGTRRRLGAWRQQNDSEPMYVDLHGESHRVPSAYKIAQYEKRLLEAHGIRDLEQFNETFISTIYKHDEQGSIRPDVLNQMPINIFRKYRDIDGINSFYDWQLKALNSTATNLLCCVSTSGGKSVVAELLMIHELLIHGRNGFYVLPQISLCNEKFKSLTKKFKDIITITPLYGGGSNSKSWNTKSDVTVTTPEKCNNIINKLLSQHPIIPYDNLSQDLPSAVQEDINGCARYFGHNSPLLDLLGVFIIDEAHLISEASRGPAVENLLAKLRLIQTVQVKLGKRPTKIICLSGTLADPDRFASMLGVSMEGESMLVGATVKTGSKSNVANQVEQVMSGSIDEPLSINEALSEDGTGRISCDVVVVNDRPRELKFIAIKTWLKTMVDMKGEHVLCNINGLRIGENSKQSRPDDGTVDQDSSSPWYGAIEQKDLELVGLLCYQSLKERKGLLIFCPTKAWTVSLCRKLISSIKAWRIIDKTDCTNLDDLMHPDNDAGGHSLVDRFQDSNNSLKEAVRYRMAYHNSDVLWCERQEIERAFSRKEILVICCTTTLAMGVNLPVHRVCIRSIQRMTWETFHQISGRAGRSKSVEGEVYVCCENPAEYKQVQQWLEPKNASSRPSRSSGLPIRLKIASLKNEPILLPERNVTDLAKFIMELFAINITWSMPRLLSALRSNSFYYKEIDAGTVIHIIAFLVSMRFLDLTSVTFDWSQGWYQSLRLSPLYLSVFFNQDLNMYKIFHKEMLLFKELWSCTPQQCKELLSCSIRLGKVQHIYQRPRGACPKNQRTNTVSQNVTGSSDITDTTPAEPTVMGRYLLIMKDALTTNHSSGKLVEDNLMEDNLMEDKQVGNKQMIYVTPLGNSCVRSPISFELMMDTVCLLNKFLRIGIPLNDRACLLGLCVNPELLYYNKLVDLNIKQIGINSLIIDLYDLSESQSTDGGGAVGGGVVGGGVVGGGTVGGGAVGGGAVGGGAVGGGDDNEKRVGDRLRRCIELLVNGTVKLPELKQFYSAVIMDNVSLMEFKYFVHYRNLYRYIGMTLLYDVIEYELPIEIVGQKYGVDRTVLIALEHQVHIIASALAILLDDLNLGSLSIIFSEIQRATKYFPQEDSLTEEDRHAIHQLQALDILKGTRGTHLYLNGFLTIQQISESDIDDLAACINKLLPVSNESINRLIISDTAKTIATHIKLCAINHIPISTKFVTQEEKDSSTELSSDDSL
ncbi:DEAD/DEAH box helicase [Gregarina niphandrodes]|uniref:DEAD/DEAH box helicase n=1 Tax=Gregarina niphandrodes TaxID=110365 RepID=A0A023AYZ6_GRENI|nr:DEAD/DEAH box helicase [Gregarina niphandrodes]EZG43525.1 DEAD/DEAH box helicase [Gregarina niphandrodes]|eukprot:XP_011133243.1 DEAD/DEAH box helicase [Gregarina niphandrodes]